MKKKSSFLKREIEKLVDLNMASDIITLDLNRLKDDDELLEENA